MQSNMMSLGQFAFGLATLPFETLRRQSEWRHPSNSRVGVRPARQSLGPGNDTITLSGVLAPEFKGSTRTLLQLREMANSGKAWALVSGAGEVFGAISRAAHWAASTSASSVPASASRRVASVDILLRIGSWLRSSARSTRLPCSNRSGESTAPARAAGCRTLFASSSTTLEIC